MFNYLRVFHSAQAHAKSANVRVSSFARPQSLHLRKAHQLPNKVQKETRRPGFASGATYLSPGTCWSANNADRFVFVLQRPPNCLSAPRQQLGQPKSCKERPVRITSLFSDAQPAFQLERPHSMSTLARSSRVKARG